jgi:hypothetical protein
LLKGKWVLSLLTYHLGSVEAATETFGFAFRSLPRKPLFLELTFEDSVFIAKPASRTSLIQ